MKIVLLLAALISLKSYAVEVSPNELRQLEMSAENLMNQAQTLRDRISALNQRPSEPQVFTGTCSTASFMDIGGDCSDLQEVLRRPRLSPEFRADIEGAIACARREAIQNCNLDNRGYCEVMPGYSSARKPSNSTMELGPKCNVTVQARVR